MGVVRSAVDSYYDKQYRELEEAVRNYSIPDETIKQRIHNLFPHSPDLQDMIWGRLYAARKNNDWDYGG